MKNKLIKMLGVTAAVVALTQTLQATPLTGTIGFTGQVQLNTSSAATATGVVNWFSSLGTGQPTVSGTTGSFTAIPNGTSVLFASPWTFTSGASPFWTIVVGAVTYTFNLTSSAVVSQGTGGAGGFVVVNGSGTVTDGTPADTAMLSWSFSTQDPIVGVPNKFTFSASSASVPDGGTTIMLLGAALSGIALLKRKLAA